MYFFLLFDLLCVESLGSKLIALISFSPEAVYCSNPDKSIDNTTKKPKKSKWIFLYIFIFWFYCSLFFFTIGITRLKSTICKMTKLPIVMDILLMDGMEIREVLKTWVASQRSLPILHFWNRSYWPRFQSLIFRESGTKIKQFVYKVQRTNEFWSGFDKIDHFLYLIDGFYIISP